MKIVIAMMKHETNSFSPLQTDWARFCEWSGYLDEDALKAFDDARAAREVLYAQESAARGRVRSARMSLIEIINLAFPRLTVIYPKQKALVESFFYKPAKGDTLD